MGALSGSREPSPSCTGLGPSGFDPERIWAQVTIGREGYCSSDLKAAAWCGFRMAYLAALEQAALTAEAVQLPEGYQWSDSNFRKFQFGGEQAAEDIRAIAMEARQGGDVKQAPSASADDSAAIAQTPSRNG